MTGNPRVRGTTPSSIVRSTSSALWRTGSGRAPRPWRSVGRSRPTTMPGSTTRSSSWPSATPSRSITSWPTPGWPMSWSTSPGSSKGWPRRSPAIDRTLRGRPTSCRRSSTRSARRGTGRRRRAPRRDHHLSGGRWPSRSRCRRTGERSSITSTVSPGPMGSTSSSGPRWSTTPMPRCWIGGRRHEPTTTPWSSGPAAGPCRPICASPWRAGTSRRSPPSRVAVSDVIVRRDALFAWEASLELAPRDDAKALFEAAEVDMSEVIDLLDVQEAALAAFDEAERLVNGDRGLLADDRPARSRRRRRARRAAGCLGRGRLRGPSSTTATNWPISSRVPWVTARSGCSSRRWPRSRSGRSRGCYAAGSSGTAVRPVSPDTGSATCRRVTASRCPSRGWPTRS